MLYMVILILKRELIVLIQDLFVVHFVIGFIGCVVIAHVSGV